MPQTTAILHANHQHQIFSTWFLIKMSRRFKGEGFTEVVLATSVTVEGDATAHLVAALAHKHGLRASRIAYGVPVGGELEFIDSGTLSRALTGRRDVEVGTTTAGEGNR